MGATVKDQEAKRLQIADLLRAQVPQQNICEIVGVSPSTVLRTKNTQTSWVWKRSQYEYML